MPEKRRMSERDRSKIIEKMSDFILLMGYNADFQVMISKELNLQLWLSSENLGLKQCRELFYLMYMADSSTLLSFTVSLGRIVWRRLLRAKRRILEGKFVEKMKFRDHRRKTLMRGNIRLKTMRGELKNRNVHSGFVCVRKGCLMRHVLKSCVSRHRAVKCQNVEVGSRMYRLAIAMCFLSFRNVCVTSEWEFWAICLVKQIFGFWRSIALEGELADTFSCIAAKFELDVVSCELLDRLQSCLRCSSTTRYHGTGIIDHRSAPSLYS